MIDLTIRTATQAAMDAFAAALPEDAAFAAFGQKVLAPAVFDEDGEIITEADLGPFIAALRGVAMEDVPEISGVTVTPRVEGEPGFDGSPDMPAQAPSAAAPSRSVTMAQARLALAGFGKLEAVQKALEALKEPERTTALTAWEYAPMVSRDGALVTTLGPLIGLDEASLDQLFAAAEAINL